MANGNEISAFLGGVLARLRLAAPDNPERFGVRPGPDGRPLGAYKGGGWYYGIFFAGAQTASGLSHEAFELNMAAGIDVTRVWSRSPTAKQGEWFLQEGELYERIGYVSQLMMSGREGSVVANACNAALSELDAGDRKGTFHEHFDRVSIGRVTDKDPAGWLVSPSSQTADVVVFVCSLAFSGLRFTKKYAECP